MIGRLGSSDLVFIKLQDFKKCFSWVKDNGQILERFWFLAPRNDEMDFITLKHFRLFRALFCPFRLARKKDFSKPLYRADLGSGWVFSEILNLELILS